MGFQSTRPRGARLDYRFPTNTKSGFNPRAREGRDATQASSHQTLSQFQSTRPRGARHRVLVGDAISHWFQSTRPRGARPILYCLAFGAACFNPRAREGRDLPYVKLNWPSQVSIHAPARGATSSSKQTYTRVKFQSTRPRGARPPHAHREIPHAPVSIHAPARGATVSLCASQSVTRFQSTRPRGARRRNNPAWRAGFQFQSTRPRGARR